MSKLTLEELKNAIREEEEKANEKEQLQSELIRAKIDTEKARAEKLRKDTKPKATDQNTEQPKPKTRDNLTTIIFLVSIGASIITTIAFFVLLIIKGRF